MSYFTCRDCKYFEGGYCRAELMQRVPDDCWHADFFEEIFVYHDSEPCPEFEMRNFI